MLKNFFALGSSQLANFLLPIMIMPLIIIRVGNDGFGKIQFAYTILLFLGFFADFSHNITAPRDIAINCSDKNKLQDVFNKIMSTRIFMFFVAFWILFFLVFTIEKLRNEYLMYLLGITVYLGFALQTNWFFQGIEQMSFIAYANFIGKAITFALIYFFVNDRFEYIFLPFLFGIGNLVTSFILIYIIIFKYKINFKLEINFIKEELINGFSIFLSNISVVTYMNAGVIILGFFVSDTNLGNFSIAERIMMASRQVLGVYSQVIYPRICKVLKKGNTYVTNLLVKIYLPFLVLVILGCALMYALSPFLVQMLANKESDASSNMLRKMCIIPFIVCLNIPAYQLLLAYNVRRGYSYIMMLGAVLFILLCTIMSSIYFEVGAIISMIIIESLLMVSLYISLFINRAKICIYDSI